MEPLPQRLLSLPRALSIASLLAAACATNGAPMEPLPSSPPPGDDPGAAESAYLSPVDHLVRASVALRGLRPSVDELRAVAADPSVLPSIVDGYLAAPEFGDTIRELHNEALLLRADRFVLPLNPPLDGLTATEINRSITDEPLRLIEHVVMNDRPYTEIVTADYGVANAIVAGAWGIPYDPSGPEWQPVHYTDGRPAAGILATGAFYLRHTSTGFNFNRGRANAVSKALLCYDFLSREVDVDGTVDLSDPDATSAAVRTNPACVTCHQTLDPLASFFYGFRNTFNIDAIAETGYPIVAYIPRNEAFWMRATGRAPAFFGKPGARLDDLGRMIADDPRFSLCAAKRFYGYLAEVGVDDVPLDVASALQQTFIESGYNARALARAVVLSDAFRASHAATEADASTLVGLKKVRPSALGRMMADLTGLDWSIDPSLMLRGVPIGHITLPDNDFVGFRVLGGGIDSFYVTEPSHTFNATSSLYLRQLAAEAASYVVERDLATTSPDDRRLLKRVSSSDTDETLVRAQLADLHARLFAELSDPTSEEVTETYELFSSVLARTGDVRRAWKVTLTAMLQDMRIAYY